MNEKKSSQKQQQQSERETDSVCMCLFTTLIWNWKSFDFSSDLPSLLARSLGLSDLFDDSLARIGSLCRDPILGLTIVINHHHHHPPGPGPGLVVATSQSLVSRDHYHFDWKMQTRPNEPSDNQWLILVRLIDFNLLFYFDSIWK